MYSTPAVTAFSAQCVYTVIVNHGASKALPCQREDRQPVYPYYQYKRPLGTSPPPLYYNSLPYLAELLSI